MKYKDKKNAVFFHKKQYVTIKQIVTKMLLKHSYS
jgi:hypothetical protein